MTAAATLLDRRYRLDEEIGAGGFCAVWRAIDTVLIRPVAVKLLHAVYAHEPEAQARFRAEALHAGALSHGNVARVYDYGEPARGQSYLVMELIEGPSLARVLDGGPIDAARTMDIVAQVASGLQAAHSAGLVHRDIKPSNIMFTPEDTVRITDFGVAHAVGSVPLTDTGIVMGSPGYIAPERIIGASAGPASDLYALGIVAFECLAAARPFSGPPLEVAIAHRDRPLPPLPASVPAEVADFVMMLAAKNPAWRPASAGETARQARGLRDHLVAGAIGVRPVDVRPAGVRPPPAITGFRGGEGRAVIPSRPRPGWTRRPRALGAAVAVLAALTCLTVVTVTALASPALPAARPQGTPSASGPAPAASPAGAQPADSPAGAQPAGQRPNAGTGAIAAVRHTRARPPARQPGPAGRENRPAPGNGPAPGPGTGPGPGNSHGPAAGNGPGNGGATVVADGTGPS